MFGCFVEWNQGFTSNAVIEVESNYPIIQISYLESCILSIGDKSISFSILNEKDSIKNYCNAW